MFTEERGQQAKHAFYFSVSRKMKVNALIKSLGLTEVGERFYGSHGMAKLNK